MKNYQANSEPSYKLQGRTQVKRVKQQSKSSEVDSGL
jgi:hypothetical protein